MGRIVNAGSTGPGAGAPSGDLEITTMKNNESNCGIYRPILRSEGLLSSTGLTNHLNGGIVASTEGVNGSGDIYMPRPIDPTKPWRCAVLIEINDSQPLVLKFANADLTWNSGLNYSSISTTYMDSGIAGGALHAQYGLAGGIPAGTKLWLGMASDGVDNIWTLHIPENPSSFVFDSMTPGYQSAWNQNAYCHSIAINAGSGDGFGNNTTKLDKRLCRFRIENRSTQNRVIGLYWNQGLNGPGDNLLNPPFMMKHRVAQDGSAIIVCPGKQGSDYIDLVMNLHGHDATAQVGMSDSGSGAEYAKLYKGGYLIFGITGGYGTTSNTTAGRTSATTANWGAPAGLVYRKKQLDWIRNNLKLTRHLYAIGLSMGGLNAARFEMLYPNTIKAAWLISPAMDLTAIFNSNTYDFPNFIRKGFGAWYVNTAGSTGVAPTNTANWTRISYGYGSPDDAYYDAPYVWRDVYNAGTAYAVNDIVYVASTLTAGQLAWADPTKNPESFKRIPIHMTVGTNDSIIPQAFSTSFRDAVNTAGGDVTLTTIQGGQHLTNNEFDGAAMLNFFLTNA